MPRFKMGNKNENYYFDANVEEAVVRYVSATDITEKNMIFQKELYHVFYHMAESISRRYGLYTPNEDFIDTVHDCLSNLLEKLDMYKPDAGYKAYSYYGYIIKNYLLNKRKTAMNKMKLECSYEDMYANGTLDTRADKPYEDNTPFLTTLINEMKSTIDTVLKKGEFKKKKINDGERMVGEALIDILGNWEPYIEWGHKKKYYKATLQSEIKDRTNFSTEELRKNINIYRKIYLFTKNKLLRKWDQ